MAIRILIVAVVAVLAIAPAAVNFLADWLWYGETGYRSIFWTILISRVTLGAIGFFIGAVWIYAVVTGPLRGLARRQFTVVTAEGPIRIAIGPERVRLFAFGAAALAGVAAGGYLSGQWEAWLFWRRAVDFGEVDPILGGDLSYYVLRLQFLEAVRSLWLALTVAALALAGGAFVLAGDAEFTVDGGVQATRSARRRLSLLAAMLFLALAFKAYLDAPGLLNAQSTLLHGASYTDVYARLPALRALMVAALGGAALAAFHAASDRSHRVQHRRHAEGVRARSGRRA
jgi:uncharacterized membrane protein (UPF0182 family)